METFEYVLKGTVAVTVIVALIVFLRGRMGTTTFNPSRFPNWLSLTLAWGLMVIDVGLTISALYEEPPWSWNLWWSMVISPVGVLSIMAYTIYGYMGPETSVPFRHKLWRYGIAFFILANIPYVGHRMWKESKNVKDFFSSPPPSTATTSTPSEFTIEAPVDGKWSERITTLHGEIIRPHGPIFLQDDKYQVVELDDVAVKKERPPILQTGWVRIRSRTDEMVKVTISR